MVLVPNNFGTVPDNLGTENDNNFKFLSGMLV